MSYVEYEKAQKMGIKAFKNAIAKGGSEYLPVLDEILEDVEIQSEVSLGLVDIPLDRVVGTSNVGRTYAFANNFMPLLDFKTEFGAKWSALCDSHLEEGIRDPIKVYEYMNNFYVIEGNKRVSVLKYFEAVTIPANVTRKIPKKTDDLQVKIYYEFMDFYKLTGINYLWFSQEGCFRRLLELTCENPDEKWSEDQVKDFGSAHHSFCMAMKSRKDKLPLTSGDAFLIFIDIYGYDEVLEYTEAEMREKINLLWEEFLIESKGREIKLTMEPAKKGRKKLMDYFLSPATKKVMVAFIFDKDPDESDWLYGHELGRIYLEENCSEHIKTVKVHNVNSEEDAVVAMQDLILMGVKIIFTTSSKQVKASLKVAANHPEVSILNCSLNTSHKLISTYYARLYEVKFLAGMIAGALAKNGRIGYVADYPIIGMPSCVNAFALGAKMINPYARVYLEWTIVKGASKNDVLDKFRSLDIEYVSDQIMFKPEEYNRQFGLYSIVGDKIENLAMPVYLWGVFYEKLIDSILTGAMQNDEKTNVDKALNYWWGLSAGVVDLICSEKIPAGTIRLVNIIKDMMINNEFKPFQGNIISKAGTEKNEKGEDMLPEDIMLMNWLVDNIEGEIPELEDLKDEAKGIVVLKGVAESDETEEKSEEADGENFEGE